MFGKGRGVKIYNFETCLSSIAITTSKVHEFIIQPSYVCVYRRSGVCMKSSTDGWRKLTPPSSTLSEQRPQHSNLPSFRPCSDFPCLKSTGVVSLDGHGSIRSDVP